MTATVAVPRNEQRLARTEPVADVLLLGPGAVGCEFLEQVAALADPRIRVVGVADQSGYVFDTAGLEYAAITALVATKRRGGAIARLADACDGDASRAVGRLVASAGARRIVVDATAADTTPLLLQALAGGCDVVLANKVPLVGPAASMRALHTAAAIHGRRIRHEATVGAGLPVIDTLHKLLDAGDSVVSIEGCPSGTLGFVFAELARGTAFSAAVRAARAAGYTEPDPRIDLSGIDVARKALILARLLGFSGDLHDVVVEGLVPSALLEGSPESFLARLSTVDALWAQRAAAAASDGAVLRHRIRVTPTSVTAGVVAVPRGGALGALDGTDNQFSFTTRRYRERPLVITGPGAGACVTASGLLGDLLALTPARVTPRGGDSR
jgi:bifunctional aspartokinase / homoserine dehydrogenase 1